MRLYIHRHRHTSTFLLRQEDLNAIHVIYRIHDALILGIRFINRPYVIPGQHFLEQFRSAIQNAEIKDGIQIISTMVCINVFFIK